MFATGPALMVGTAAGGGAPTTWNPSAKGAGVTLSGGNLIATVTLADSVLATTGRSSGKWYWEILIGTQTQTGYGSVGFAEAAQNTSNPIYSAPGINYRGNGSVAGGVTSGTPLSFASGDVIGIALDMTGLSAEFFKNNTTMFTKTVSANTYYPAVSESWGDTSTFVFTIRPDGASQSYAPPSGFASLD